MEPKKLYRSSTNKMICGVCQGVAEYINIDLYGGKVIMGLGWFKWSGNSFLLYCSYYYAG